VIDMAPDYLRDQSILTEKSNAAGPNPFETKESAVAEKRAGIPRNRRASAQFQALVPEMERIFRGGWKWPEKPKPPLCRGF
jgi:hypothetical protein